MARNYDLSDPTDLEVLKSDFDFYSADEWQQFIDFTLLDGNKKLLSYDERGILMQARKKKLYNNYPSSRQMMAAIKIAEKIEEAMKKAASAPAKEEEENKEPDDKAES
ncbi:MAG: hypothetical protein AAFO07_25055 [Bacteroidota bacterium]